MNTTAAPLFSQLVYNNRGSAYLNCIWNLFKRAKRQDSISGNQMTFIMRLSYGLIFDLTLRLKTVTASGADPTCMQHGYSRKFITSGVPINLYHRQFRGASPVL